MRDPRDVLELSKAFREANQEMRADYLAGKNSRFIPAVKGIVASGSGADYHYRHPQIYYYMIERARDFDRNNLVVQQGINRLVANIMQDGFSLDIDTGDTGLDEALGTYFREWAENPDLCDDQQELDFNTLAELALRHTIVDGDCLALPTVDGTLQMVEAHRLRSPSSTKTNATHGILFDERRRRKEYWICRQDLSPLEPLRTFAEVEKYKARDKTGRKQVFHIYDPKRFSQSRGVTAFATLVYALSLHDDVQFATLVKQQVASCFAIIREIEADLDGGSRVPALTSDAKAAKGGRYTEEQADGTSRTVGGIAPGMDVRGRPGEKITGFAPNIPSPEFFTHAHMILQFVAVNLDMPLQMFLLDPTKTNFSGWRGAIDQARIRFRKIQRFIRSSFHKPVYLWRVRQAMQVDGTIRKLAGAKSGKFNVFEHKWNPPSWKYIEPHKDAQADKLRKDENLAPSRVIASEKGDDYDDLVKACVDDRFELFAYAGQRAAELNKQPGFKETPVTWRDLANQAPPTGVKVLDPNAELAAETAAASGDQNANN